MGCSNRINNKATAFNIMRRLVCRNSNLLIMVVRLPIHDLSSFPPYSSNLQASKVHLGHSKHSSNSRNRLVSTPFYNRLCNPILQASKVVMATIQASALLRFPRFPNRILRCRSYLRRLVHLHQCDSGSVETRKSLCPKLQDAGQIYHKLVSNLLSLLDQCADFLSSTESLRFLDLGLL